MGSAAAAVASAFGLVFVAELGDKTQLAAMGFGARHPLRVVLIGLALGFGAAGALAAVVGGVLGAAFPERPIQLLSGVLFLAFAVATLLGDDGDQPGADQTSAAQPSAAQPGAAQPGAARHRSRGHAVVASIALTIALAEMGDKTQLTTAALAAKANPVAVWAGATLGEVAAAGIGAVAGQRLSARLNPWVVRIASALAFAVFGVLALWNAR